MSWFSCLESYLPLGWRQIESFWGVCTDPLCRWTTTTGRVRRDEKLQGKRDSSVDYVSMFFRTNINLFKLLAGFGYYRGLCSHPNIPKITSNFSLMSLAHLINRKHFRTPPRFTLIEFPVCCVNTRTTSASTSNVLQGAEEGLLWFLQKRIIAIHTPECAPRRY